MYKKPVFMHVNVYMYNMFVGTHIHTCACTSYIHLCIYIHIRYMINRQTDKYVDVCVQIYLYVKLYACKLPLPVILKFNLSDPL